MAEVTVSGPVLPLTLLAAVGDGVTLGALGELLVASLLTSLTTLPVRDNLRHYKSSEGGRSEDSASIKNFSKQI